MFIISLVPELCYLVYEGAPETTAERNGCLCALLLGRQVEGLWTKENQCRKFKGCQSDAVHIKDSLRIDWHLRGPGVVDMHNVQWLKEGADGHPNYYWGRTGEVVGRPIPVLYYDSSRSVSYNVRDRRPDCFALS